MIYSLDIRVAHASQARMQAVIDALPPVTDPTVSSVNYVNTGVNLNGKGFYEASCKIRFNAEIDRTAVFDIVTSLTDILANCEPLSYIREHKCYHDEAVEKRCEVEILYEVTE